MQIELNGAESQIIHKCLMDRLNKITREIQNPCTFGGYKKAKQSEKEQLDLLINKISTGRKR